MKIRVTKKRKLPKKPSALIRIAVADLEAVEKDPRYEISMKNWHRYSEDDRTCKVCFAGSVMARQGAPLTKNIEPGSRGFLRDQPKYSALDSFRLYHWNDGITRLSNYNKDVASTAVLRELDKLQPRTYYKESPVKFKNNMLKAAKILAEAEL